MHLFVLRPMLFFSRIHHVSATFFCFPFSIDSSASQPASGEHSYTQSPIQMQIENIEHRTDHSIFQNKKDPIVCETMNAHTHTNTYTYILHRKFQSVVIQCCLPFTARFDFDRCKLLECSVKNISILNWFFFYLLLFGFCFLFLFTEFPIEMWCSWFSVHFEL